MIDRAAIIIAALSARALASSARRAGFAPLSIDVFGDDDTRQMSLAAMKLDGGLSGLTPDKVEEAVRALIDAYSPIGIVYGSGFERQPETIAALSRIIHVFGNEAETVKRAKDPCALARLCEAVGISHPTILFAPPDQPEGWLVKQQGGAGGAHIRPATAASAASADCYFQRRVAGESISALFVANGEGARIIGLSMQWASPAPGSPFRYGGAAGPIEVDAARTREIEWAVGAIASELRLVGLNSADFIVSPDAVWLIEINPRPGATLDVFEPDAGSLLAVHVAGCQGRLTPPPTYSGCKSAEIVYAPCDFIACEKPNWPSWAADRPSPGTPIAAGDPLCTVLASGATVDFARICAKYRAQRIRTFVEESGR